VGATTRDLRRVERVWVTGVGAVTPLGGDVPSTMARLFAGERGIGTLGLFELAGARSTIAAEAKGLVDQRVAARTDALALQAAREALGMAGLSPAACPVDLVVGGTTAGMLETEELLTKLDGAWTEEDGVRLRTHPLSSTVDRLHEHLGPFVMARTLCCACTSGVAAIALAMAWLSRGRGAVLAGGADGLCRLTYSGFGALGVLAKEACRPYDADRAGLNLGEGAGFLVLERESFARARGATPLAEISAVALGGEAHHITNPEPTGRTAARIMTTALRRAGIAPEDVGYVNLHGTATRHNDAAEGAAVRACFGEHRVPASSSKGQFGHTLGAAGAIEAVVSVEVARTGRLPPTVGLVTPDPACDVDHVTVARQLSAPPIAISNSFGFGGTGGTVVVAPIGAATRPTDRAEAVVVVGAAIVARGRLVSDADGLASLLIPAGALLASESRRTSGEDAAASDPTSLLDPNRARRMDRAGKLATVVALSAIESADRGAIEPLERETTCALSGTAFGNVDGSMRFMRRVLEKGAGFASPADFPNLVPSSPVSHAAIYLGLGGPAIATPDLSATAEAAIATGLDLVAAGSATAAISGSIEEVSDLAERVLAPLLGVRALTAHCEGASAIALEAASSAERRGKRALASVVGWTSSRGTRVDVDAFATPTGDAVVIAEASHLLDESLADTAWLGVRRLVTTSDAGDHVGMGGIAFACAVGWVARERVPALVVGGAPDRVYAFLLAPSERVSASDALEADAP